MKKLMLMLFLICLALSVMADPFVHEGDHNYAVMDTAMTTKPYLNGFLIFNFDAVREDGSGAKNIHVHLKTFDDRNALVHDYSVKIKGKNPLTGTDFSQVHQAVIESEGYSFFRILESQEGLFEDRIVSDDNGHIAVRLKLNSCGINETKDCYYQTARYRVEISQEGLSQNEYFTVHGEEINDYWFWGLGSFLASNAVSIGLVIMVGFIAIGFGALLIIFIRGKLGGR